MGNPIDHQCSIQLHRGVVQLEIGGIDIVVLELPTLAVHGGTPVDYAN